MIMYTVTTWTTCMEFMNLLEIVARWYRYCVTRKSENVSIWWIDIAIFVIPAIFLLCRKKERKTFMYKDCNYRFIEMSVKRKVRKRKKRWKELIKENRCAVSIERAEGLEANVWSRKTRVSRLLTRMSKLPWVW